MYGINALPQSGDWLVSANGALHRSLLTFLFVLNAEASRAAESREA
jgi:hypothetical protein